MTSWLQSICTKILSYNYFVSSITWNIVNRTCGGANILKPDPNTEPGTLSIDHIGIGSTADKLWVNRSIFLYNNILAIEKYEKYFMVK